MSRYRTIRCQCSTRWLVNFGDRRGELPTSALVAATASGMGLGVKRAIGAR